MNKTLFDAFETWLQDRIRAAFNALLGRIERLEVERANSDTVLREHARLIDDLRTQARDLETFNVDDQITGLRVENDRLLRRIETETQNVNNLYQEIAKLNSRLAELEDRRVENASDEQLTGFKDRVIECFDSEEFRDAVNDQVAEYINNSDDVCSLDDVRDILRNDVRVSLDVERY